MGKCKLYQTLISVVFCLFTFLPEFQRSLERSLLVASGGSGGGRVKGFDKTEREEKVKTIWEVRGRGSWSRRWRVRGGARCEQTGWNSINEVARHEKLGDFLSGRAALQIRPSLPEIDTTPSSFVISVAKVEIMGLCDCGFHGSQSGSRKHGSQSRSRRTTCPLEMSNKRG